MLLHSIIIGCHLNIDSCNTSIFIRHNAKEDTETICGEKKKTIY